MDATKENAGIPNDKANAADKHPPDSIKEAELLRIRSEIARNEAETRKFNSEAKDSEGRHSKGKTDTIIKAVIGGMIAAGLLVAWFISYMQPILEKNQRLGEIENRLHAAENKEKNQKLKDDSTALNVLQQAYDKNQIAYNKDLQIFKAQNDSLKVQQEQLILTYAKKIKNQGDQNSAETKRLKDELIKLKAEQQKTETRSGDINDAIISNWLMENKWKVEIKWKNNSPRTWEWKFYLNGNVYDTNEVMDAIWLIRDGTLAASNGTTTFRANISKIESPVEGTMSNTYGSSGTWKMTKE